MRENRRDAGDLYWYYGNMALTLLLYAGIVVMVRRGNVSTAVRKFFQIVFLVLWVVLFAQCICAVKEFAVLIMYATHDRLLFGLCTAWLGLAVVVLTLALRGRTRSPFCFWACPLGTVQDLTETGIHKHFSMPFASRCWRRLRRCWRAWCGGIRRHGSTTTARRPWRC